MRPLLMLISGFFIFIEAIDAKRHIDSADEQNPLLRPYKTTRAICFGFGGFIVLYSAYHLILSHIR